VGRIRKGLRAGAVAFVRRHRVRLESARFIDRVWMRERLAWDPEVEAALVAAARRTNEPIPLLRERVDAYVEEIAPYFSLSTYYQFGQAIAKAFVTFCFEMVVDHAGFERQARAVPEGAVRVYVINHRSNFDPLVLAYGLMRQIALSYAVGEWALVWPLSSLFRAFGSYFVRRGETDPLYHAVLERFVQLQAGHGAVTGFFVEGGLTRDGALRRPRTGLLQYLIQLRREFPDREIVFLPVGLNYDRVLEDRYLVRERDGRPPRPTVFVRGWNLLAIVFWLPPLIGANLLKVATRSHRKFGYAAISFGRPLRLTDWPGGSALHALDAAAQPAALRELAEEILYRRVGEAVPATPVSILCTAFLRRGPTDEGAMAVRIGEIIAELRRAGAPVALGDAFASIKRRSSDEAEDDRQVAELDEHVLDSERADLVLTLATSQLVRRRVLRRRGKLLEVGGGQLPIVEYYANSIRHHLEPNWLATRAAPAVRSPGP
jgi:glycerol-3-phosphate O-acyltransferase